uniref:Transposase n=2 Tax=Candidatus Kentrum sp. TC TaxID=2126339 RepID=A0A450ZG76_9GAMM|nr:MAG: hypothetical protein BECKTC1821D_GA0114238_12142 [Candidatus Kentron sp. TC]
MSEYCRENGLYVEQMERWKEFAIAGTESGTLLTRGQRQEWQRDKNGYPWRRMGKRLFASRAEPSAKSGPIFILSTARYENEMLH